MSETCGTAKEATILNSVSRLEDIIGIFQNNLTEITQRNPSPEGTGKDVQQRPDNALDEIQSRIDRSCKELDELKATFMTGIANKL